jgi:tellurite resistance protein TerC
MESHGTVDVVVSQEEELNSVWLWVISLLLFVRLLLFQLLYYISRERVSRQAGLILTLGPIVIAALTALPIGWTAGGEQALDYLGNYLLELIETVEASFILAIILSTFKIPINRSGPVLVISTFFILLLRTSILVGGDWLTRTFPFALLLSGATLLFLGLRKVRHRHTEKDKEEQNVQYSRRARFFRSVAPTAVSANTLAVLVISVDDPIVWPQGDPPFLLFLVEMFGLLSLPYCVIGLRSLIGKLVYIQTVASVLGGFMGLKVILFALNSFGLFYIPTVDSELTVGVVVAEIIVTVAASLLAVRRVEKKSQHEYSHATTEISLHSDKH